MKQVMKNSLQAIILTGLIVPTSASAGILSNLEAQCQCLTESVTSATLGQLISLGVMLTLVTGIVVLKWVYRRKKRQAGIKKNSKVDSPAVQIMNELKIGARFSDWSSCKRLAGNK